VNLLDEEGNLFGVVNVIDALVVLFVLAIVVAGAALVFGGGGSPDGGGSDGSSETPAVRYATIDLGTQPWYVAERIDEGDVDTPAESGNVTVTDVYASPSSDGDTHLYARVAVGGITTPDPERDEPTFRHEGNRIRIGQEFSIETPDYAVTGRLTSLERADRHLPTETTPVVLQSGLSATAARQIEPGDRYRIGNHTLATVETVAAYPTGADKRRVLVGINLTTIQRDGAPTFAGRTVGIGSSIPFRTADYELSGEIVRRGTVDQPGEEATARATLSLSGVSQARADGFRAGMTETVDGQTLATIEDVAVEPSQVVTRTDDGDVLLRDHPRNRDVTIDLTLQVRRVEDQFRFHGVPLRVGDSVTLDLGTRTLTAEVEDLR
jgi:hypothetical protein